VERVEDFDAEAGKPRLRGHRRMASGARGMFRGWWGWC